MPPVMPTPSSAPVTPPQSDQFSQLVERLGQANNVLITISDSPSVDQLAALLGLTIALNKQGKHATAVFSGEVPSTIEFLEPERTIETNTDSLRDFIISLDKSKADKLRYKVEDEFVKIFITPYKTSITDADLAFSQGDFNIDLIIMLGIHDRAQLDAAITAHGRILHDATVAALNIDTSSDLGSINWLDTNASSLCEMVSDLILEIDKNLLDPQISTSLLTGMVAETNRFGNERAHPHTMSVAGALMAAGASPQLVSSKLEEHADEPADEIPPLEEQPEEPTPEPPAPEPQPEPAPEPPQEEQPEEPEEPTEPAKPANQDGTIQIDHGDDIHIDDEGTLRAIKDLEAAKAEEEAAKAAELEKAKQAAAEAAAAAGGQLTEQNPADNEVDSNSEGPSGAVAVNNPSAPSTSPVAGSGSSRIVLNPPSMGGQLTANSVPEHEQYSGTTDPISQATTGPTLDRAAAGDANSSAADQQTLSDLERAVNSSHVDEARSAVEQASNSADNYRPEPINALGASPVNLNLGNNPSDNNESPADGSNGEGEDKNSNGPPPPVPPPLMPTGV